MIIALLIMAGAAASAPIVAAVVVSVASRREDRGWTLGGPAVGMRAAARRIVDFHTETADFPQPKSRQLAGSGAYSPRRTAIRAASPPELARRLPVDRRPAARSAVS